MYNIIILYYRYKYLKVNVNICFLAIFLSPIEQSKLIYKQLWYLFNYIQVGILCHIIVYKGMNTMVNKDSRVCKNILKIGLIIW